MSKDYRHPPNEMWSPAACCRAVDEVGYSFAGLVTNSPPRKGGLNAQRDIHQTRLESPNFNYDGITRSHTFDNILSKDTEADTREKKGQHKSRPPTALQQDRQQAGRQQLRRMVVMPGELGRTKTVEGRPLLDPRVYKLEDQTMQKCPAEPWPTLSARVGAQGSSRGVYVGSNK